MAFETILTPETLLSPVLATAFGGVIGIERERADRPAGLRIHMLISLGSCLFILISLRFTSDPARIAAGIVTGIGLLCAGAIWAEKDKLKGITRHKPLRNCSHRLDCRHWRLPLSLHRNHIRVPHSLLLPLLQQIGVEAN